MGGFLSILLSIKYPVKIALINPCLNPQDFCIENKLVGQKLKNPDTQNEFVITDADVEYMTQKSLFNELLQEEYDQGISADW